MFDSSFNFDLDETLVALRDSVRHFAQKEIAPIAAEVDQSNQFPLEMWKKLGDLGVLGVTVSEEYGGANMGYLAHTLVMEEISRASASIGLSYGAPLQPVRQPDLPQWYRCPAREIPAQTGQRRPYRCPGHERARCRFRRGQHGAACR